MFKCKLTKFLCLTLGSIPLSYQLLPNIHSFRVASNLLSGPQPDMSKWALTLQDVAIAQNNFRGLLDPQLFPPNVSTYDASFNSFSGSFSLNKVPVSVSYLNLAHNSYDKVSFKLGDFQRSTVMNLTFDFSGNSVVCPYPQIIDLLGLGITFLHTDCTTDLTQVYIVLYLIGAVICMLLLVAIIPASRQRLLQLIDMRKEARVYGVIFVAAGLADLVTLFNNVASYSAMVQALNVPVSDLCYGLNFPSAWYSNQSYPFYDILYGSPYPPKNCYQSFSEYISLMTWPKTDYTKNYLADLQDFANLCTSYQNPNGICAYDNVTLKCFLSKDTYTVDLRFADF